MEGITNETMDVETQNDSTVMPPPLSSQQGEDESNKESIMIAEMQSENPNSDKNDDDNGDQKKEDEKQTLDKQQNNHEQDDEIKSNTNNTTTEMDLNDAMSTVSSTTSSSLVAAAPSSTTKTSSKRGGSISNQTNNNNSEQHLKKSMNAAAISALTSAIHILASSTLETLLPSLLTVLTNIHKSLPSSSSSASFTLLNHDDSTMDNDSIHPTNVTSSSFLPTSTTTTNNSNNVTSSMKTITKETQILQQLSSATILSNQVSNTTRKHLSECPPYVHLSSRDCAPQLSLDSTKLTLQPHFDGNNTNTTNEGANLQTTIPTDSNNNSNNTNTNTGKITNMQGYRMVRASHGINTGMYYFEVTVLDKPSIIDVINSLPQNVRFGSNLWNELRNALLNEMNTVLEYEKNNTVDNNQDGSGTSGGGNGDVVDSKDGDNNDNQNKSDENTSSSPPTKKVKTTSSTNTTNSKKTNTNNHYPISNTVGGHLRIGWSMRTGELQAPVGYDRWSYAIRDINGSRIHNSKREDHWGGEGFTSGDIVGFSICLVGGNQDLENTTANTTATNFNSVNTNSQQQQQQQQQRPLTPPLSSKSASRKNETPITNHIRFFKNGQAIGHFVLVKGSKTGGAVFDNIQPGTYYPALSSYMGGSARVNFGPYFVYPPKGLPSNIVKQMQVVKPMSDICPVPPKPEEVMELFKKEKKLFGNNRKTVDENITNALNECVLLEATIRRECYEKNLDRHVREIREGREKRGLSTADLPPVM